MKRNILIIVTVLFCLGWIKKPVEQFVVTCPKCTVHGVLDAKSVTVSGSVVATNAGVLGVYQQANASFKCDNCRNKFTAPIKPDKFVPTLSAIPVASLTNAPLSGWLSRRGNGPASITNAPAVKVATSQPETGRERAARQRAERSNPPKPKVAEIPRSISSGGNSKLELIQRVKLPDGSEIVVYHWKP